MKKQKISAFIITLALLCGFLPQTARAAAIDISAYWGAAATTHVRTISTSGTVDLTALSGTDAGNLTLTVNSGAAVTFQGDSTKTYTNLSIRIAGGAKVTLDNVSIDNTGWPGPLPDGTGDSLWYKSPVAAIDSNAGNTLYFEGTSTLRAAACFAAVCVGKYNYGNNTASLIISGADSGSKLYAYGGEAGPGIGSNGAVQAGSITISGGTVAAQGGTGGAGIGGGDNSPGGTVTITGGTVTAQGGTGGAGIGGGDSKPGGTVTITGGTVTATGTYGAGIGDGGGGSGGACYFSGGSINASSVSGTPTISSGNSTPVYLTTVTLPSGTAVSALSVNQGGSAYSYGAADMQADSNKKLYLYLPAGNTTADITTDEAYTGYYGTVATSGTNVLKMDQAALSISGVIGLYTYGDTISPSVSGGSGTGAVTYNYKSGDGNTNYGATKPTAVGSYMATATKAADASYYQAVSSSVGFSIVKKDISTAGSLTVSVADQTYTGSQLKPSVTVKDGAKTLVEVTDYTVTYGANVNAGTDTGSVKVDGMGNYTGSVTKNFTINAKTGFTVADIVAQTYTGSQLTPSVTVKDGAKTLVEETDYTVIYGANVNVGTGTGSVKVDGMGNYTGSVTKNFTIAKATGLTATTPASIAILTSNTGANTLNLAAALAPTVPNGMSAGTISYTLGALTDTSGVLSGASTLFGATLTYTGTGKITGTATQVITISSANFADVTVTLTFEAVDKATATVTVTPPGSITYGGTLGDPSAAAIPVTGTIADGAIYTYSYAGTGSTNYDPSAAKPTAAGSYAVTATLVSATHQGVSAPASFTISAKALTQDMLGAISGDMTYSGSAITPSITVTDGSTLIMGTDYTLGYSNNTDAGTATVTVSGKGNYEGSVTKDFTIKAKTSFTVANIADQTYTGSQIAPSVTVTDGAKTLVKDTDYTVTYGANVNAGTGTGSVKVDGKGNYAGSVTKNFTIKEAASSGGSTAAQYQATVGSDKNAVTISGQGSSASVTVTSAQIAGGTTVTMPEIPGVTSYQVVLPAAALNGSQTGSGFVIKTSAATLTAPADMLSGINGTKVQLSIGTVSASELPGAAKAAVGGHPVVSLSLTADGKTVIWNNSKAPVTVSIPYKPTAEELAHSESIVIWYIDDSGNVFTIPSGHYDKTTGTVTFNTTHFSDYAVAYRKVSFTDVNDTAWYSSAVDFLAARGITSGTTAKTFSPDATLTRGQFITMLLRAYSITADTNLTNNFSDAGNTYYTGYLASAKRLGITSGVGDNKFAPDAAITRQEMFTLLYNALKVLGKLPPGTSGKALSDFTDAGSIASWATDAMTALVKAGTVSGNGDKLNPTGTTTRAEMAQVLYNLLGK